MIFAHPRSGSSQLRNIMLANGLTVIYEPFNQDLEVSKYYPVLMEHGLDEALRQMGEEAVGFKHIWEQVHYRENDIMTSRFKTILLWRENLLDMAISYWVAHQTQIWDPKKVGYQYDYLKEKIILRPTRVADYMIRMQRDRDRYIHKAPGSFHLTYEGLFGPDGLDRVAEALRFVGGEIKDLEATKSLLSPDQRQNRRPWSEVIGNWDEVMRHLADKRIA